MKKFVFLLVLLLSLTLVGCGSNKGNQQPEKPVVPAPTEPAQAEKVKVTLYFSNEQADALVPVEREIDKPGDMVVALINELSNPEKHVPVLPAGTELIYYQKEGKTITLNFNQALANMQGTTGEFIAINSLVNTITELPEFNQVVLLVDKKPLTTGHAIYDKPLQRNDAVISKK